MIASTNCCRQLFAVSSFLQLLLVLGYDNRSSFSSAMNVAAASSSLPTSTTECAVVGVGVLGTSLCKQLLRDPDFKDWKGMYYVLYCTVRYFRRKRKHRQ